MDLNILNNKYKRKQKSLKIGDNVKYTSGIYGDMPSNPLWGGQYGNKIGKIMQIRLECTLPYYVKWGPGNTTNYDDKDIEKI
jgi:predicted metallo-beta-lactamase superfamily hydrolase